MSKLTGTLNQVRTDMELAIGSKTELSSESIVENVVKNTFSVKNITEVSTAISAA